MGAYKRDMVVVIKMVYIFMLVWVLITTAVVLNGQSSSYMCRKRNVKRATAVSSCGSKAAVFTLVIQQVQVKSH